MERIALPESVIPLERLEAFGDAVCLRDPRGRGPRPALVPLRAARGYPALQGLAVRGGFTVLQRFAIAPEEGRAFVEVSRDANPLHTEDDVVSGAMTAARLLLLPEVLVPSLAVRAVRVKFRAFSRYGRATVNRYAFAPQAGGSFRIDVEVLQEGVSVAEGVLQARLGQPPSREAACPCESLASMRAWLASLRLDPDRAFAALGYGYPRAYLASLPSGEMVRQGAREGGAVGLLNALDLEFPEEGLPALRPEPPPQVEVETTRPRSSFRKVLARVAHGMVTYCRGYATVLLGMVRGRAGGAPDAARA